MANLRSCVQSAAKTREIYMKTSNSILALLLALPASSAFAGAIPYPNTGTVAPEVPTYAAANGGINIYYYGSTAADTDYVQVYDVQTGYNSGSILNNHATTVGTEISVGTGTGQINAGDQLLFYIETPSGQFASLASYSSDNINHAYITSFDGGTVGTTDVPAGLYVALEDLPYGASDLNYNDDTFVFTGVSAPTVSSVTPEPTSLALFGTGLLGTMGAVRRRMSANA